MHDSRSNRWIDERITALSSVVIRYHFTSEQKIVHKGFAKCYFGVMNPGHLTPHRSCAVRCISGGIPPILMVQEEGRQPATYLLVSADGSPVDKQVLAMVAEPVQITGDLVQQGSLRMLRADLSNLSPHQKLKISFNVLDELASADALRSYNFTPGNLSGNEML